MGRCSTSAGSESGAELTAVTPTAVWRLLIGLLPGDDEL